jgi:hypothetical protein
MTEILLRCTECRKNFKESNDTGECGNCSDVLCSTCAVERGLESLDCKCDALCSHCRGDDTDCEGCGSSGCMLCMQTECYICEADPKKELGLLCDNCVLVCEICHKKVCLVHSKNCTLRGNARKRSDKVELGDVCDNCIGVGLIVAIKRAKTKE